MRLDLLSSSREIDNDILKTKGSLWIDENNLVQEYEDKPQENINRFNAFWNLCFQKACL